MNPYLLLTIIGILAKLWAAYRFYANTGRLNPAMLMSFIFLITAYGQKLIRTLWFIICLQHPEYNRLLAFKTLLCILHWHYSLLCRCYTVVLLDQRFINAEYKSGCTIILVW